MCDDAQSADSGSMTPGNETAAPNNGHAPDQRIADLRHDAAALRSLGAELALASMTADASQFRLHELASGGAPMAGGQQSNAGQPGWRG